MRRSEIRETIFILLFMEPFYPSDELMEEAKLYMDSLKNGQQEVKYASLPDEREENYIYTKFAGVLREIPEIDAMLNQVSDGWKTNRMGKADLSILRLAVYEMLYDESIPTGVAINEAVELAKRYGEDNSPSFVNGILGRIAKDRVKT